MENAPKKKWYAAKKVYVPALLMTGVMFGSALNGPTGSNTQRIDSSEKGVKGVQEKVQEVAEPTSIPTKAVTATLAPTATSTPTKAPLPTRIPTKKYIAPTRVPATMAPTQPPAQTFQAAPVTGGSYGGGDKDCGDFSSHSEAQSFFIANGGPGSDPHRLDADSDGLACESLP